MMEVFACMIKLFNLVVNQVENNGIFDVQFDSYNSIPPGVELGILLWMAIITPPPLLDN